MKNNIKRITIISVIAGLLLITITIVLIVTLSSNPNTESHCKHEWVNATCEEPKTCSKCGETSGEALGHNLVKTVKKEATCISSGIYLFSCTNCSFTEEKEYNLETLSGEAVFDLAKDCTVEIITYDKSGTEFALGSGFVYKNDGQIITNYHVIEDGYSAVVYLNEIKYPIQKVLAYDIERDIAVLKINASNLKTLTVCSLPVKTGSPVYAIGSSKGLTATFTQGIVTTADRTIDNVTYIQHDAPISSGNSGGPLINSFGEIIGVNTMTVKNSQNLNFAINVKEIGKLSFSAPMTLQEVYNKESDPFKKMKKYLISDGEANADKTLYTLTIGVQYTSGGYKATRGIGYNITDNDLYLLFLFDNEFLTITLNENSYNHEWYLANTSNNNIMLGTINGHTFSESTTYLPYTSTNIYNYTLKKSFNELAVAMANYLLSYVTEDLSVIRVTASDLGFIYY